MAEKRLNPEELVKYFKDEFKTKIKKAEVKIKPAGAKKRDMAQIWMTIDKSIFSYPHHFCIFTRCCHAIITIFN